MENTVISRLDVQLFISDGKEFKKYLEKVKLTDEQSSKKKNVVLNTKENIWGNGIREKYLEMKMCKGVASTTQWTNQVGECIVKEILICLGETPGKPTCKIDPDTKKKLSPDFESEKGVYEVKTRNWTTSGTAGEKVLGTPYKYLVIPKLYKKPLFIVLVGYQEEEYRNLLDKDKVGPERKEFLEYLEKKRIFYVFASKMLKKILP